MRSIGINKRAYKEETRDYFYYQQTWRKCKRESKSKLDIGVGVGQVNTYKTILVITIRDTLTNLKYVICSLE